MNRCTSASPIERGSNGLQLSQHCLSTCICLTALTTSLANATTQATWFLKIGSIPDYVRAGPTGPTIWQIIRANRGGLADVRRDIIRAERRL